MIASRSPLCVSLLCCALLPAQQFFTSPAGILAIGGDRAYDQYLFARNKVRWQQVDASNRGTPRPQIRSIAWRRFSSGVTPNPDYVARTIDVAVLMTHAIDVKAVSQNLDANYQAPATTVFTTKSVNLPDWQSATFPWAPQPFSITLPFDMLWSYDGASNLLWEVRADNNSAAGKLYGNDFKNDPRPLVTTDPGYPIHGGCIVGGQSVEFVMSGPLTNDGSTLTLTTSAVRAPASAQVFLFLDSAKWYFKIPEACGFVIAGPLISAPIATSNTNGDVPATTLKAPFIPALTGGKFYTQLMAAQPALPFPLSSGRESVVPAAPTPPVVLHVFEAEINNVVARYGPWNGGIIARFEH